MEDELDLVVFEDDEGNELTMEVLDYFFYEGQEYALLAENVSVPSPSLTNPPAPDVAPESVIARPAAGAKVMSPLTPVNTAGLAMVTTVEPLGSNRPPPK